LVAWPDGSLRTPLAAVVPSAHDHAVHLVEPAVPAARPGLYVRVPARHRARAVRLLLDRRAHDPARPAARSDLEPGDLPHPEADVPGPAPARAPQPGRLPGLHPRLHHDPAAGLRDGLRGRTAAPAQDLGDEMSRLAHLLAAPLLVATLAASAPAPA